MALAPGLYEQLVTESLARALKELPEERVQTAELDPADAHVALTRHCAGVLARALQTVPAEKRLEVQLELCNWLLLALGERLPDAQVGDGERLATPARQLVSIARPPTAGREVRHPLRPSTPLGFNALLVNAGRGEPTVGGELAREIDSADEIDLLCAFIRWHGLRILLAPLERFFERGGKMRVITTTYLGATETRALDELWRLGAEIRVTYETEATRLHAKAWLFGRRTGRSTAYIGSSNLSKSALIDGLEWNVRISAEESPAVIRRFRSAFESYWEAFTPFDRERFERELRRQARDAADFVDVTVLDVEPAEHQRAMLYDLEVARHEHGRWRNLVVAATGTGKTLVAAFDFKRLLKKWPGARLLFVAHRKEILTQSRSRFRAVLRDGSFGELYVDGMRPERWNHVFASIQSLSRLDELPPPDHFDVVIVDEFHHAEAPTYRRLLKHLRPRLLLGLTATPERADGTNVADELFDGHIDVELRLWDALERNLLAPFHYFGVGYEVDLSNVRFRRGQGYDVTELEKVYTAHDSLVAQVIEAVRRIHPNASRMRAIGFCVSKQHARFMASRFNHANLPASALTADSPRDEREAALARLSAGELRAVFTVDLFNEGVDIPDVDTLLFLRPTESATLFLQQLGRGLRKREGKVLTVLDFIGRQHVEFRFDLRFRALFGISRGEVRNQIEAAFPHLPPGCHFELDPVARERVLENVRRSLKLRWDGLVQELRRLGDVTLRTFLRETGMSVEDLYQGTFARRGFAALRREAGVRASGAGPAEVRLARALVRLTHADDRERIDTYIQLLRAEAPREADWTERQRRFAAMLSASLWDMEKFPSLEMALAALSPHEGIREELGELLELSREAIRHHPLPLGLPLLVPLHVHARYSLVELMAAFGLHTPQRPYKSQRGVEWVPELECDLLFVTLKKDEREFSPTTRYRDYALSPRLFHWETPSMVRATDEVARRYFEHRRRGSHVLLFVREQKRDARGFTVPYTFLGPAEYVRHEGERPVAITWRLREEMPPDVFSAAAAVR